MGYEENKEILEDWCEENDGEFTDWGNWASSWGRVQKATCNMGKKRPEDVPNGDGLFGDSADITVVSNGMVMWRNMAREDGGLSTHAANVRDAEIDRFRDGLVVTTESDDAFFIGTGHDAGAWPTEESIRDHEEEEARQMDIDDQIEWEAQSGTPTPHEIARSQARRREREESS